MVDESSVVIGDVELGDDVSVWPLVAIRGDMHSIKIGRGSNIQDSSVLHITHAGPFTGDGFPLTIGEEVVVGHSVTLHGCTIENNVLVGMGAVVLDGAHVESNVIIGSGTVVSPGMRLETGHLYLGQPAKQIRPLKDKEIEFMHYAAKNYIKLKDEFLAEA
jgi:carbonic anhydrase/acetyltransferase-like protein (isoleucine patch superfamily)